MENFRDEIALRALHGLLSNYGVDPLEYSKLAGDAYSIADEFLKARQVRHSLKTDSEYCKTCGARLQVDGNVCSVCREPAV